MMGAYTVAPQKERAREQTQSKPSGPWEGGEARGERTEERV
jgi:hypothetical protein